MGRRCSGPQLQRWAPSHAGCDRTYCRCDGQKAVGTAKRGQTQECRRTQYLPGLAEYMASYARKFVQYGVRIVGGCCGTTPQHIKAIRSSVRSISPSFQPAPAPSRLPSTVAETAATSLEAGPRESSNAIPLEHRSRLGSKIARGEFIRIVEMIPPMGHDFSEAIERAKYLQAHDVDAINVTDAPRSSARMNAISLAIL